MAEFCKKCFIKKILTPHEIEEYNSGILHIAMTDFDDFCETCGNITNVVDYIYYDIYDTAW